MKKFSIHFGNENWNLVLNMMIGIRKCITNIYKLNPTDMKIVELDEDNAFDMISTYPLI